MQPYYHDERSGITIYLGDCREVLPALAPEEFGGIMTDPPYPDYHVELYGIVDISFLEHYPCRQFVFWSSKADFPLSYTAIHIWDKKTGAGSQYERIFERNGGSEYRVFRHYLINSTVAASFTRDIFTGHKSQKPATLMCELIEKFTKPSDIILDPFMGSGTTLEAAKRLGRRAIGIEIEERYCEIAARRLQQEVMELI